MRVLRLVAVALVAHFVLAAESRAGYASIVTFGDSLSDTGNVFAATSGAQPPAPYYQGRYSNGPVWVETLAKDMGVPAPTPSSLGGTDWAWAGALSGTGTSSMSTPNLLTQVGQFIQSGHTLNSSQLVTVWAGGNDFLANPTTTNPQTPVDNIATAITQLTSVGGKNFVVPNLPLLGELPGSASLPSASRQALDALTTVYNSDLAAKVDQLKASLGVKISYIDINAAIQQVRNNPGGFGFTNATHAALSDGVVSGQGYLFWDSIHPTTAGHAIIAGDVFAQAVPEPSSVVLFAFAGAVLLGRAGWKARALRRQTAR
jgi:phospholipase/lecithinase/hemolysin